MGRQVTFFATEEDRREFTAHLETIQCVVLDSWTTGPGLFDPPEGGPFWCICRSEDTALVTRDRIASREVWDIDVHRALVIEWNRHVPGPAKTVGKYRLWYSTSFLAGDEWVDKPIEFVKFGDRLCRWVRRWGTYREELGGYLAPGALPLVPPRGPRWLP